MTIPSKEAIDAAIEYADMQRLLWMAKADGERHADLRNCHRKNEQTYASFVFALRALRLLVEEPCGDMTTAGYLVQMRSSDQCGFGGIFKAMRDKLLEKAGER